MHEQDTARQAGPGSGLPPAPQRTPLDVALGIAALLLTVGGFLLIRRKERELRVAAERAYPGPLD